MNSYGIVGFQDTEIGEAIKQEYGKEPEKEKIATGVAEIAGEFSRQVSASSHSGVQGRREYRRKCKEYISKQAKERIPKPVGFFGGFIFMAVLSGIISWIVQKLMKKYFDEQKDS